MAPGDFIGLHRIFPQLSGTIADTMLSQVSAVWAGLLQTLTAQELKAAPPAGPPPRASPGCGSPLGGRGIARPALLEQVATRTLALLLQGICSHSSSPLPG